MTLRSAAAALAVAVVAVLWFAGAAAAEPTPRACPDFATRFEAQAALEAHTADADRLDPDHDGVACHSRLGEPAASDERATGDGGGAATFAFVLGGVGAGVLAAGALRHRGAVGGRVAT